MESQQTRLIKALQRVHRDVQQSIKEEDMNEIVAIVRACGFDFESVPESSASHIESGELQTNDGMVGDESQVFGSTRKAASGRKTVGNKQDATDVAPRSCGYSKKRRRKVETDDHVQEPVTEASTGTGICFDDGVDIQMPPLEEPVSSKAAELYQDPVTSPNITLDPETRLAVPDLDYSTFCQANKPLHLEPQYQSGAAAWELDEAQQSTMIDDSGTYHFTIRPQESDQDSDMAEPSSIFSIGPDWENMLWWDPSLVYDMGTDELGSGADSLDHSLSCDRDEVLGRGSMGTLDADAFK